MFLANDIIARAQQDQLDKEAERIKLEREKRADLRAKAKASGLSIGELVSAMLREESDDKSSAAVLDVPKSEERAKHVPTGSFPPPPSGPSGSGT